MEFDELLDLLERVEDEKEGSQCDLSVAIPDDVDPLSILIPDKDGNIRAAGKRWRMHL